MKKIGIAFVVCLLLSIAALYFFVSYHTNRFIGSKTAETGKSHFNKLSKTELYIIGVTHKTGPLITYDSLYNTLEKIKPDVILFEYDSTGFDKQMNLKTARSYVLPAFLNSIRQSNLEEIAVRKYLFHNNFAIVRPYEWAQRNQFHKVHHILTFPDLVFTTIDSLDTNRKLTAHHRGILHTYISLTKRLNAFADSNLHQINSPRQDSLAEQRQNSQYHRIKEIVDHNAYLEQYKSFYKINEAYWDIRNRAMADNIDKYISLFPTSRIVVLTGYFHRYYLRKLFQLKKGNTQFVLKDI